MAISIYSIAMLSWMSCNVSFKIIIALPYYLRWAVIYFVKKFAQFGNKYWFKPRLYPYIDTKMKYTRTFIQYQWIVIILNPITFSHIQQIWGRRISKHLVKNVNKRPKRTSIAPQGKNQISKQPCPLVAMFFTNRHGLQKSCRVSSKECFCKIIWKSARHFWRRGYLKFSASGAKT